MKTLIDLFDIIKNKRRKDLNDFKLFELIQNKEKLTREEYQKKMSSKSLFNFEYKGLRNVFFERIFSLQMDLSKYNRDSFTAYRKSFVAIVLISLGKKNTGIRIAKEALTLARKTELIGTCLTICRQLENYYAVVEYKSVEYSKYSKLVKQYSKSLQEEQEAQSALLRIIVEGTKRKKINYDLINIDDLEGYYEGNKDIHFRNFYYYAKFACKKIRKDVEAQKDVCIEANKFFATFNKSLPFTVYWVFNFELIPLYIAEGKYAKAGMLMRKIENLPKPGGHNFHETLVLKAILGLCSGKMGVVENAIRGRKGHIYFNIRAIKIKWGAVNRAVKDVKKGGDMREVGEELLGRFYL